MKYLLCGILFFSCQILNAKICQTWGTHSTLGHLDHKIINESSGLIVSQYPNRLYHVNDSGDGAFFYQTTESGLATKKIEINNFFPQDVESLAYGNCADGKGKCIILADIGDNNESRDTVSFVVIKEELDFPDKVDALATVVARYPDGAHNVEAVAMHPNGDLYILTKVVDWINNRSGPAQLFVLRKEQLLATSNEVKTLELRGIIDLPFHLYNFNLWGRIATGFDISPLGDRILIATYKAAVEIKIDLGAGIVPNFRTMKLGVDFTIIPFAPLLQIESIAYANTNSFLYTTEYHKKQGPSPIVSVSCTDLISD